MFLKNKKKKILIILGHPDWDTFSGYLASRYEEGANEAGHEVRRVNIGDITFDPILHKGYKVIQELEPDLVALQESIKWADHVALVYPTWWGGPPAILKGLFDRIMTPGFSFRMNKGSVFHTWTRLLKGRTGRIITTMDNNLFIARLFLGDYTQSVRRSIFWFNGIWPARVTKVSMVRFLSPEQRSEWGEHVAELGRRGV